MPEIRSEIETLLREQRKAISKEQKDMCAFSRASQALKRSRVLLISFNRLHSIAEDATFVESVADTFQLPLVRTSIPLADKSARL